jgi:hypothetical protein
VVSADFSGHLFDQQALRPRTGKTILLNTACGHGVEMRKPVHTTPKRHRARLALRVPTTKTRRLVHGLSAFLSCRGMFVFPLIKRNFKVVVVVEGRSRCGQPAYPLTYQPLAASTRLWARRPQAQRCADNNLVPEATRCAQPEVVQLDVHSLVQDRANGAGVPALAGMSTPAQAGSFSPAPGAAAAAHRWDA